jgi:predicted dehydrogenase
LTEHRSAHPVAATSRRNFLKTSAAALATLSVAPAVHAAGSDALKVGLIGCGGRGTGAAAQALHADKNVQLTAMGDMFEDRLQQSLATLSKDPALKAKIDVKPGNCFTGFDAYSNVIKSGVDVVLLCTPPHFRPLHLKAAIEANKHVFAEKPMAVDAPGVRSVLETAKAAKDKNLSLVAGFCWRYHPGMRETVQRIHDGAIGDVQVLQCTYNTGGLWHRSLKEKQDKGWSDMEWQLRNWLYFTWLSGDFNVEQHCHSIDKMAWVMKNEYPVKAVGLGGRQVRTDPDYGHIFDHHAVTYEYANGAKCFSQCRQQVGAAADISDHLYGTKGICDIWASRSQGVIKSPMVDGGSWRSTAAGNMYQVEHDELFASIRNSKPINNGEWMAKSSLMAIMGRMATYTGQAITWDMALNSQEKLGPSEYKFGPLEMPPVALPGVTKFV